jgi:hypothetical protein
MFSPWHFFFEIITYAKSSIVKALEGQLDFITHKITWVSSSALQAIHIRHSCSLFVKQAASRWQNDLMIKKTKPPDVNN